MKMAFGMTLSLFFALTASAQAPVIRPVVKGTTGVSQQPQATGPAAYTPSLTAAPVPTKDIAIENNGQAASKKQGQGGAAAAAALAAMAATMAATCPACEIRGTCPICIASTIGAAASGQTGSNMDNAQSLSNGQVKAVNPTATPGQNQSFVTSPAYTAAMKDIKKATQGTGVSISKDFKTITTPDGRTIDAGKAASSGAGLSGGELSLLKDQFKKAQDAASKASVAAAAAQDGEGTGVEGPTGGGPRSSGSDPERNAATGPRVRQPANIAGASKDLNGDPIGVAVDSVFEMMHRRYRVSVDRDMFIPQER